MTEDVIFSKIVTTPSLNKTHIASKHLLQRNVHLVTGSLVRFLRDNSRFLSVSVDMRDKAPFLFELLYCHCKIPSDTNDNNFRDCILPRENDKSKNASIATNHTVLWALLAYQFVEDRPYLASFLHDEGGGGKSNKSKTNENSKGDEGTLDAAKRAHAIWDGMNESKRADVMNVNVCHGDTLSYTSNLRRHFLTLQKLPEDKVDEESSPGEFFCLSGSAEKQKFKFGKFCSYDWTEPTGGAGAFVMASGVTSVKINGHKQEAFPFDIFGHVFASGGFLSPNEESDCRNDCPGLDFSDTDALEQFLNDNPESDCAVAIERIIHTRKLWSHWNESSLFHNLKPERVRDGGEEEEEDLDDDVSDWRASPEEIMTRVHNIMELKFDFEAHFEDVASAKKGQAPKQRKPAQGKQKSSYVKGEFTKEDIGKEELSLDRMEAVGLYGELKKNRALLHRAYCNVLNEQSENSEPKYPFAYVPKKDFKDKKMLIDDEATLFSEGRLLRALSEKSVQARLAQMETFVRKKLDEAGPSTWKLCSKKNFSKCSKNSKDHLWNFFVAFLECIGREYFHRRAFEIFRKMSFRTFPQPMP